MAFITQVIYEWGERCFGKDHMRDRGVRSLRLAEEAIECAQALGVPADKMHQLVDVVYARPHGDAMQELGGVLVTTHALCAALGFDVANVLEIEVRRCLSKSPEHFAERNKEKLGLGLD